MFARLRAEAATAAERLRQDATAAFSAVSISSPGPSSGGGGGGGGDGPAGSVEELQTLVLKLKRALKKEQGRRKEVEEDRGEALRFLVGLGVVPRPIPAAVD